MERTRIIQLKPALHQARDLADTENAERRASQRRDMTPANSVEAVNLVDLSTHGCCLGFAAAVDYRPGQFIRLGFAGETEAVRAIVRWTAGERIGAEFTSELADARVEAILGEGQSPLVGLL